MTEDFAQRTSFASPAEVTIGRDPATNLIAIDHEHVSARHAKIVRGGPTGLYVSDFGGPFGTFVNGARVTDATPIRLTDDVRLGSVKLALTDPRIARLVVHVGRRPPRGEAITLGRDAACDVVVDYEGVEPRHATVTETPTGFVVQDLGTAGGTGIDHPGFTVQNAQANEWSVLYLGAFPLPFSLLARLLAEAERGQLPAIGRVETVTHAVSLDRPVVTIGRAPTNDLIVPHPTVSSHHARLSRLPDGTVRVEDLGSSNGTYVNGTRVRTAIARPGDRVAVGAVALVLSESGAITSGRARVRIDVVGLSYVVPDRNTGKPKKLLDDISLSVLPNEMVGLLGPSGAGKTTLLMSVLGLNVPSSGGVLLNGRPLFSQYDAFRTNVGYVPQDDIVHPQLRVHEALRFACRLRLPSGTPRRLREEAIERTLRQVGLHEQRDLVIGSPEEKILSGGQRRRVNLAIELVTDPALLVLDEPTSGLSWRDAADVIAALRRLADEGRTIILTIHQPDFQEYEKFDSVAILGKGGKLLFIGPAKTDSYAFFGVPEGKPRDIFDRVEQMEPDAWRARFRQTETYRRYVAERAPGADPSTIHVPPPKPRRRSAMRQLPALVGRNILLTLRGRAALLLLLLQAPLLGVLIGLTTRGAGGVPVAVLGCATPGEGDDRCDRPGEIDERFVCDGARRSAAIRRAGGVPPAWIDPNVASASPLAPALVRIADPRTSLLAILLALFLPIVIVGSNALVSERTVYARERLAGLNIAPYVIARFVVLAMLGAVITTLHLYPALWLLEVRGAFVDYWIVGFATTCAAAAIGLALSAAVKTQMAALWGINLLIVPQLLFAGVITKLDGLRAPISFFTATRWGLEALTKVELVAHR
ncbi:MAG: FHA domain-containing protein, partial [Deltaproteobacteria bacterium]|nr:FHA domain-containing protein [Deltaproteobacteria bacterium]